MQKIKSLFKRNYDGDRLIYNEVVEGCEWVLKGEGEPTIKLDGTSCKIEGGKLFKRYDRRPTKAAVRSKKKGIITLYSIDDLKEAPKGWIPAEKQPDLHTGHWPGWVLIGEGQDDKWHREGLKNTTAIFGTEPEDGTYELIGPKINGGRESRITTDHILAKHGEIKFKDKIEPLTFEGIKEFLKELDVEGIVWHHPDGRMVKIKKKDFGFKRVWHSKV